MSAELKYAQKTSTEIERVYARGEHAPFFGLTIVSCERGAIRQSPDGLYVYTDAGCEEVTLPSDVGRSAELIELRNSIAEKRPVFPDGRWGRATLEVCLAIRELSQQRQVVELQRQVAVATIVPINAAVATT